MHSAEEPYVSRSIVTRKIRAFFPGAGRAVQEIVKAVGTPFLLANPGQTKTGVLKEIFDNDLPRYIRTRAVLLFIYIVFIITRMGTLRPLGTQLASRSGPVHRVFS